MPRVQVLHDGGDRFLISMRGHVVAVDQPVEEGGGDTGPTPTELLLGSLASCVAFYARRYLHRHGLEATGLVVQAVGEIATRPARLAMIDVVVTPPSGFPSDREEALLRVISGCTVHNTMTAHPEIRIALDGPAPPNVT